MWRARRRGGRPRWREAGGACSGPGGLHAAGCLRQEGAAGAAGPARPDHLAKVLSDILNRLRCDAMVLRRAQAHRSGNRWESHGSPGHSCSRASALKAPSRASRCLRQSRSPGAVRVWPRPVTRPNTSPPGDRHRERAGGLAQPQRVVDEPVAGQSWAVDDPVVDSMRDGPPMDRGCGCPSAGNTSAAMCLSPRKREHAQSAGGDQDPNQTPHGIPHNQPQVSEQ
jgi:hypothetical protein